VTVNQRYQPFDVTTPPATTVANPLVTSLNLGDVRLDRIFWRIPPGPSGLCGIAIIQTGTNLWPWGPVGTYLVGDDEYDDVPIGTEISNGITIQTYNTDIYSHTWYLKFLYTPMALVVASVSLPVVQSIA
jgi:hypothetical protein